MDRFKQIETFVRVADAGSLAAAALEEGVSPVVLGRLKRGAIFRHGAAR